MARARIHWNGNVDVMNETSASLVQFSKEASNKKKKKNVSPAFAV